MFAITERLLLRPGWREDAPALAATIGDEGIARHLTRVPWPYTHHDAERFLALPHDPLRPRFLIFRRADARLVGGIGLYGEGDAELGYWIARDQWGGGIATEAGRAVVAIADATLRLPRLTAAHADDNPASARVLAKLGFVAAGGPARVASLGRGGEMEVRRLERINPAASRPAQLAA